MAHGAGTHVVHTINESESIIIVSSPPLLAPFLRSALHSRDNPTPSLETTRFAAIVYRPVHFSPVACVPRLQ